LESWKFFIFTFSARRKGKSRCNALLQNRQVFDIIKKTVKSLLTILLIAGLMGGAVIGLLTMNHHGDCIASQAAGVVCPLFNALAYIGIHADFLRSFSEAFLVMIFSMLLFLALFISFVFSFKNFYPDKIFISRFSEIDNANKHKQIYWLSLFENSPTVL